MDIRVGQIEIDLSRRGVAQFKLSAGGQRVYVIPSEEMIIVRTGAGGIDISKNEFLWDDAIIPNALIRGVIPKTENPATN